MNWLPKAVRRLPQSAIGKGWACCLNRCELAGNGATLPMLLNVLRLAQACGFRRDEMRHLLNGFGVSVTPPLRWQELASGSNRNPRRTSPGSKPCNGCWIASCNVSVLRWRSAGGLPRPSWNPLDEIFALVFARRSGRDCGCFAFWAWLRLGRNPLWTLAGIVSLVIFALVLTRIEAAAGAVPSLPMGEHRETLGAIVGVDPSIDRCWMLPHDLRDLLHVGPRSLDIVHFEERFKDCELLDRRLPLIFRHGYQVSCRTGALITNRTIRQRIADRDMIEPAFADFPPNNGVQPVQPTTTKRRSRPTNR